MSDGAAPAVAGAPLLSVRDLHASFATAAGSVRAVRGVDLDLARGERLGLVGESGCGKSAFAMSVSGLLAPPGRVDSGRIVLDGEDLGAMSEKALLRIRGRRIGVVFQDALTGLDPVKTIGAQIAEGLRAHDDGMGAKAAAARAEELLAEVGITSPARRAREYPHQFSGGMRQRVMIAIAISNDPDLLIADEPTTALDVTTQAQILRLLGRMSEDHGCAVVLITHDLGIVAAFCESVAVMYAGRIVERSTVETVFREPLHPYTRALMASTPRPGMARGERLREIGGAPPNLLAPPPGCAFEPRCPRRGEDARCATEPPAPRDLEAGGSTVSVECHLAVPAPAEERAA